MRSAATKVPPAAARLCLGAAGLALAGALLVGAVPARAVVPVNGRHQRLDFTAAGVRAIAAKSYARRLKRYRQDRILDRDPRLLARVRHIGARLISQAVVLKPQAAHWDWEVHLVDSADVDAFCMAGGKIVVSATFVKGQHLSDGELAALLGHEIAHAIAEHVREQLSAVHRLNPAYAHLDLQDTVGVVQRDLSVWFELADLSRLQELEADDIGIYLAAKSGFKPRAALRFYRKLARLEPTQVLIDTHGSAASRLRAVENFTTYAQPVYRASMALPRARGYSFH